MPGVFGAGSGFGVGWRAAGGGGGEGLFQGLFRSVGGAFILAGDWAIGYHSMEF